MRISRDAEGIPLYYSGLSSGVKSRTVGGETNARERSHHSSSSTRMSFIRATSPDHPNEPGL
jgi:hypothetical protein